jgi:hypothetical protein
VITANETQIMRWYAGRPSFPAPPVIPSNASRPIADPTVAVVTRKNKAKKPHAKKRDSGSTGKRGEEGSEPLPQSPPEDSSPKSDRSQRVDLIVEDTAAEERERDHIRRHGSSSSGVEHKKFVYVRYYLMRIDHMLTNLTGGNTPGTST